MDKSYNFDDFNEVFEYKSLLTQESFKIGECLFTSKMDVDLVQYMGDDSTIINSARVSTVGVNGGDVSDPYKLINWLMRDRHGSPFEHVTFTFRISTPIFIAREFMRHRIASYNEESGRYKVLDPKFYIINDSRYVRQSGKPADYTYHPGSDSEISAVRSHMVLNAFSSYERYLEMIENGIAREVARMVLPLNIYTNFYVTMNARGLMNFLSLRQDLGSQSKFASNPQHEIAVIANKMSGFALSNIPLTMKSFADNGYVAP